MTSERQYIDPVPLSMRQPYPIAPPSPPPAHRRRWGFWKVLRVCWKILYIGRTGPGMYGENYLIIWLTGKTKGELAMIVLRAINRWRYYVFSGALAAGGVALSVHFDDPDLLLVTVGVTMFTLTCAWLLS